MYPSTAILLLIFGNSVASEQNCPQIPNVLNAQLQDRKDVYQRGDTIHFACDVGHISSRQIKYVCSDEGWWPVHDPSVICRLKPCVLPDDIPNGYYQFIKGEELVFGTTIKYYCNVGYQMTSREDTRTCYEDGWSNHIPVCESLSCDAPPDVPGIIVEGLSFNDDPIQPDRVLVFSCPPGFSLNGPKTLVCGKDGKWDRAFPNCIDATCELPDPGDNRRFLGAEGSHVSPGSWITVQCVSDGSSEQVQCLSSGQWDSTFPSCTGPRGCESPPPLENGDYLTTITKFDHNTRVEYDCQAKYTRQGRYKTCINGEWTGDVTCLKPCTVDQARMAPHNIKFKVDIEDKLYAPHNDHLTFLCVAGASHDGAVRMRQKCINGEMVLPTCVFRSHN